MNKFWRLLVFLLIIFSTTTYNTAISDSVIKTLTVDLPGYLSNPVINPMTKKMYISYGTLTTNDCGGACAQQVKPLGLVAIDLQSGKIIRKFKSKKSGSLAINPNTNKIYLDTGSKKLLVLNGENGKLVSTITLTREIPMGENPSKDEEAAQISGSFAIDLNKNLIYLTNYHSGTIAVINGTENEVISNIKVSSRPSTLALNPNTNKLYVGYGLKDEITIIDTLSNSIVGTIDIYNGDSSIQPSSLAVDTSSNRLYVQTNYRDNYLFSVDLSTENLVNKIEGLPPFINYINVNSNTNKIYASISLSEESEKTDKVLIILDTKNNQEIKSFLKGEIGTSREFSITIDSSTNLIYYFTDDKKIVVIDGNNN